MIAHPAAEKSRAVAKPRIVTHMRAGIGLADHDRGMLENLADRFGIALGVDMHEAGFEIFFERQIEKTIQAVFSLRLGDCLAPIFFQALCFSRG